LVLDLSAVQFLGVAQTIFKGSVVLQSRGPAEPADQEVENEITFSDTRFESTLNLGYLSLNDEPLVERILFTGVTFEDVADFSYGTFPSLDIQDSNFYDRALFVDSSFTDLNLVDLDFEGRTDFSGSLIDEVNFTRINTEDAIIIRWDQFGRRMLYGPDGEPDGDEGCVRKHLPAWSHIPRRGGDSGGDVPWATASFPAATIAGSRLLQVEAKLLFWKANFTDLGLERDARKAEREIIALRRDYMTTCFSPEWIMTWVLGPPSDFGASPFRPLWISSMAIPAFALYYWARGALRRQRPQSSMVRVPARMPRIPTLPARQKSVTSRPAQWTKFWVALCWSVDTFVPIVAVTAVKEWDWELDSKVRNAQLIERLLGLYLFSAAAYSVSSYLL